MTADQRQRLLTLVGLPSLAGAAHLSDMMAVPLMPSHSASMPSAVYVPTPVVGYTIQTPHSRLFSKLPNKAGGFTWPISVSGC